MFVVEPAAARRAMAAAFDFVLLDASDPVIDLIVHTEGRLADVVFDAAAVPAVAAMLHELVRPGGSIAVVGAYGLPVPVDLQAVMFKELELRGHRTYLPPDLDAALRLLESHVDDLGRLVTEVITPDQVGAAVEHLRTGRGMKYVVDLTSP